MTQLTYFDSLSEIIPYFWMISFTFNYFQVNKRT